MGLKWSDVDLDNNIITVNKSIARIPGGGYTLIALKTKSSIRQIPIPVLVLNELRRQKDTQDEWKKLTDELYQDEDLVICTNSGTIQDPRNVVRDMKRLMKEAKVKEIRFHDMQHTHKAVIR